MRERWEVMLLTSDRGVYETFWLHFKGVQGDSSLFVAIKVCFIRVHLKK